MGSRRSNFRHEKLTFYMKNEDIVDLIVDDY